MPATERPLTDYEKDVYTRIFTDADVAAVRCTVDGEDRVAICSIFQGGPEDDFDYTLYPLALLLTSDEQIEALTPPDAVSVAD